MCIRGLRPLHSRVDKAKRQYERPRFASAGWVAIDPDEGDGNAMLAEVALGPGGTRADVAEAVVSDPERDCVKGASPNGAYDLRALASEREDASLGGVGASAGEGGVSRELRDGVLMEHVREGRGVLHEGED